VYRQRGQILLQQNSVNVAVNVKCLNPRTAGGAKAAPFIVFLLYISCPSEFSIALRRIPIEPSQHDGMTLRF